MAQHEVRGLAGQNAIVRDLDFMLRATESLWRGFSEQ